MFQTLTVRSPLAAFVARRGRIMQESRQLIPSLHRVFFLVAVRRRPVRHPIRIPHISTSAFHSPLIDS